MSIEQEILDASRDFADAVYAKQELEDNRIHVKMAAIDRIMASGDNPHTGKPWSFSAAEAAVNTDEEYATYLQRLREATRHEILTRGVLSSKRAARPADEATNV